MKRILKVRNRRRQICHIDFWCCDVCGVGAGTTKYPSRHFKHAEETLYAWEVFGTTYELCSSCLESAKKYKPKWVPYNLLEVPRIINRTKRSRGRGKKITRFDTPKTL